MDPTIVVAVVTVLGSGLFSYVITLKKEDSTSARAHEAASDAKLERLQGTIDKLLFERGELLQKIATLEAKVHAYEVMGKFEPKKGGKRRGDPQ
jgi:hypothetical protein